MHVGGGAGRSSDELGIAVDVDVITGLYLVETATSLIMGAHYALL